MSTGDLKELRKRFGPLGKSLTLSSAYSLYDQLCSIEEGYSEELELVQGDVNGSARFGFVKGALTKRGSFSGFASLTVLGAEIRNPKGSPKLQLTSLTTPFFALVAVKKTDDDVEYYLRLVGTSGEKPTVVISLAGTASLVTVVALPLTADGLTCVLNYLIALLERKARSDAPVAENLPGPDIHQGPVTHLRDFENHDFS